MAHFKICITRWFAPTVSTVMYYTLARYNMDACFGH